MNSTACRQPAALESATRDTVPLCVNLDGALIRSSLLSEGIARLVRVKFYYVFAIIWWALRGRAVLAQRVIRAVDWEATVLPENEGFLNWLREQHEDGREIVLCTATSRAVAQRIAARYELFDGLIASEHPDPTGDALMNALVARFGVGGYDFVVHRSRDVAAWKKARQGIAVAPERRLRNRMPALPRPEPSFAPPAAGIGKWLRALRLHQWAKNLLIFLPVAAAHKLIYPLEVFSSGVAFALFGMCASGTYVLNDLMDLDSDRLHPTKRGRPFAAGDLSLGSGLLMAFGLIDCGLILASVLLDWRFIVVLVAYIITTLWYSRSLKRIPMVDVLTLASLYALRVIAGSAANSIMPSFWLLAFAMFLFLSLAVAKRYSELKLMMKSGRRESAGRGYTIDDVPLLQSSGLSSGYTGVLVLALYVNSEGAHSLYAHPRVLWLLCPLLLYWITRVWMKTSRGELDDDPVVFALSDPPSMMVAGLAAILIFVAL